MGHPGATLEIEVLVPTALLAFWPYCLGKGLFATLTSSGTPRKACPASLSRARTCHSLDSPDQILGYLRLPQHRQDLDLNELGGTVSWTPPLVLVGHSRMSFRVEKAASFLVLKFEPRSTPSSTWCT